MNLSVGMTRALGSADLFLKRNAPTILTSAGVVGFMATTVLACRATGKAIDVMPKISEDVREVKEVLPFEDEKAKMEALIRVYARSSVTLLKVYYPVVLTGSASIICVLSAHNMMRQRQASLLAAYTALDASYKAYRSRVAERYGEDADHEFYRGVARTKLRALDETGEDGEEQIDMHSVRPSPYARFFDETSNNWTKTPEYNLLFLRSQQDWANDRLRAYGHIFLNEVYDGLGLERSQAGQIVGWKLDGNGDGFVDFGLYSIGDDSSRAFINNIEHTVLLDFNVDGPIKI